MTIKGTFILTMHRMGLRVLRLTNTFNRNSILKAGSQSKVHIVDKNGLIRLAAGNEFNENLFLKMNRDRKFPEFLQLAPPFSIYFIICDATGRFIASATLRPEQSRLTGMIISQISVHPEFRNLGYATRLLLSIVEYLNTVRPDVTRLTISKFMPLGQRYLRRKFIQIAPHFKAETFEIYQETFWDKLKRKN